LPGAGAAELAWQEALSLRINVEKMIVIARN
jgi:hypothetical protein